MIWFACKGCGKKHARPESAAGTLVFCECGQGNVAPWESTAPAEEAPPVEPPAAAAPALEPVLVGEDRVPVARAVPAGAPPPLPPRPDGCLQHPHLPAEQPCDACQERFCGHCLVLFQGRWLCGPCKNFEVRRLAAG